MKQGDEEVPVYVKELDVHRTSDGDKPAGDDHKDKVAYEWEDFFVD